MPLSRDADYLSYLYTCNRCRSCAVDRTPEMRPVCPCYARFGFFAYSGGGKGYVAQGILEGKVEPSAEVARVAMNCLLCGACANMCPPGFDTKAFIRDLRDHLAGLGFTLNDKHRDLLEQACRGHLWGAPARAGMRSAKSSLGQESSAATATPGGPDMNQDLPTFTGDQEILVFAGCRERARPEVAASVARILAAAGVSWGVLDEEICCGAPLLDLGDRASFERQAGEMIARLNAAGAERVLALCPHCAATLTNEYFDVADLEVEIVSLPRYLAELQADGRFEPAPGDSLSDSRKVTFHDPCRLSRFLEEDEEPRALLDSLKGLKRVEMGRSGKSSWCCGSGAWAAEIVPDLSRFAARQRVAEARATGAQCIVTACSYCTDSLQKAAGGKIRVVHLADLMAERIGGQKPKRQ